ncbi:uncharacterized protein M421DRAFT_415336 [Didymella exigua CBS 183.55]|uniref:Inner kinetochore subunit AME1 domain-containing protein n=1 Tax=Didymella exigua CBS 183.55 TaxID=1150837 RepID=A0A6A5S3F7_9PLEO|nr:uncharacterized protein M421DRAFT_415336 [Didymella exigua CBS 183.55]KAF1934299.1 hypothetical protein M421DRAFT_415336 [Didymella exigua CBS 183.55]
MAPVDRREHRQQRVRGAGASTVQASFGFDFGALGAKQSSLPPQRSGRRSRTPAQGTPRNLNGSAKRHRSLSAPHSTKSRRDATPRNNAVIPQLGKRKRGSSSAAPPDNENEEEDELSPDRVENVGSVERSRRLARTASPIREEPNEAPDELSIIDEAPNTVRKTPRNVSGLSSSDTSASAGSRRDGSRRSKPTDVVPVTPGMQPHSGSRQSFALLRPVENTASNASQAEDEDADELSPSQNAASTPRVISRESIPNGVPLEGEDGGIDELSPTQATIPDTIASVATGTHSETVTTPVPTRPPRNAGRGMPRKTNRKSDDDTAVTSEFRKPLHKRSEKAVVEDEPSEEQQDELSPEAQRTTQPTPNLKRRTEEEVDASDEESDEYEEEMEPDEPVRRPTPKPIAKRTHSKQVERTKPASDKPPRKRQKSLGPKLAISVMRMKGYGVRGITVADTMRTILEEAIDHRLSQMLEKMQTLSDLARRKEMRSEVNLALSFKESLNEKLLDLQDANDVLTTNLKKMRTFKRSNAELRKDILALQNSRQEIALEHDDAQAEFEGEKAKIESRNTLSTEMFEIETAVQNGRKKAKQERREDEGPDIPLSMLLETVGRDVGSVGGGLLANVKSFNSTLERAAGWLEGRA